MANKKQKKRVGSIIFRIILILIAGLTVGLSAFSMNASGLVGNQLPMPFGIGMSVVLTDSMAPVLRGNDLIIVTEQDSYQVDDIVVYQKGHNSLTIHRIIEMDDDKVITKGDANNVPDDPITVDDIRAKLKFRIPFVGLIVRYIKTVPGTLLILVLAVFLLYRSRQKERDKDREEIEDIVEEIKRLRTQQGDTDTVKDKKDDPASSASPDDKKSVAAEASAESESSAKPAELPEESENDAESVVPAGEAENVDEDAGSCEDEACEAETAESVEATKIDVEAAESYEDAESDAKAAESVAIADNGMDAADPSADSVCDAEIIESSESTENEGNSAELSEQAECSSDGIRSFKSTENIVIEESDIAEVKSILEEMS